MKSRRIRNVVALSVLFVLGVIGVYRFAFYTPSPSIDQNTVCAHRVADAG